MLLSCASPLWGGGYYVAVIFLISIEHVKLLVAYPFYMQQWAKKKVSIYFFLTAVFPFWYLASSFLSF